MSNNKVISIVLMKDTLEANEKKQGNAEMAYIL